MASVDVGRGSTPIRDDRLAGVPGTWCSFKPAKREILEKMLPCAEPPPSTPFLDPSAGILVGWRSLLTASYLCWRYTPTRRRQTYTVRRIWVSPTVFVLRAPTGVEFQR